MASISNFLDACYRPHLSQHNTVQHFPASGLISKSTPSHTRLVER